MDDHYVPGPNAHLDTSWLKARLNRMAQGAIGRDLDDMELEGKIYGILETVLQAEPDQPHDDAIVCRYMDTEKFLWFVTQKAVHLGTVAGFDDRYDCAIPSDYYDTVCHFFSEKNCAPLGWEEYANDLRHDWLISCWTLIDSSFDDYLLWHRYAGGPRGVGVTVKYGQLCDCLMKGLRDASSDYVDVSEVHSGLVSYRGQLKLIPFNKRRMFENEKEVRFVAKATYCSTLQVSISDIFKDFRLRFSADVPAFHRDSIEDIWYRFGGEGDSIVSGD